MKSFVFRMLPYSVSIETSTYSVINELMPTLPLEC